MWRKKSSQKKETLVQVFSYEFCEISKNTFSYRTPLVAASVRITINNPLCQVETEKPFALDEFTFLNKTSHRCLWLEDKTLKVAYNFCFQGMLVYKLAFYNYTSIFYFPILCIFLLKNWSLLHLKAEHANLLMAKPSVESEAATRGIL